MRPRIPNREIALGHSSAGAIRQHNRRYNWILQLVQALHRWGYSRKLVSTNRNFSQERIVPKTERNDPLGAPMPLNDVRARAVAARLHWEQTLFPRHRRGENSLAGCVRP